MQINEFVKNFPQEKFDDIEVFQKKFKSFFGDNFWKSEEIKNFVKTNKNLVLVAFSDKKIIGLGIFIRVDVCLDIYTLFVAPFYRNKNIGSKFLDKAKLFCNLNSLKNIKLEVNRKNKKAIEFYKKNNFLCIGTRKNYYGFNDDALIMEFII